MAATYKMAKESMSENGLNKIQDSSLKPDKMLPDYAFHKAGLYSKEEIEKARFDRFSRFGRVLDPYGRLVGGREYLFFVKPDLHICIPSGYTTNDSIYELTGFRGTTVNPVGQAQLRLNPQLNNNPYFTELIGSHPQVVKELQYSLGGVDYKDPFNHLLSFSVSSNLSLDGSTAETLDNPATIYGTSYKYLRDSEASDENYSFQLEFVDNKYLDTYHFFKGYSEYHLARKSGLVTPPSMDYYRYRRLHNTMGIYKFVVDEDMETLIYWAYLWGVYPTSCPREAFSDPTFDNGLTFSVSFESAFIEDMTPTILYQFNQLMAPVLQHYGNYDFKKDYIPVSTTNTKTIDGTLPIGALVDGRKMEGTINSDTRYKYRLRWYKSKL